MKQKADIAVKQELRQHPRGQTGGIASPSSAIGFTVQKKEKDMDQETRSPVSQLQAETRNPASHNAARRRSYRAPATGISFTVQRTENDTNLLSQPEPEVSLTNDKPIQRVIVRVGYDDAEAKSWNPFINSRHKAVAAKAKELKQANPKELEYDFNAHGFTQVSGDTAGNTLHIVGHGQPGKIDNKDASAVAAAIKKQLDGLGIQNIKMHSCFSNIKDAQGESSGHKFKQVFGGNVSVEAASGIHYTRTKEDTANKNLPPRFTGYMYAQNAAKKGLIKQLAAKINLMEKADNAEAGLKQKITEIHMDFSKCINPMNAFMTKHISELYKGLDPLGQKTGKNKANHDNIQAKFNLEIDDMPPMNYPEDIQSLKKGLWESYSFTMDYINRYIRFLVLKKQELNTEIKTLRAANQDATNVKELEEKERKLKLCDTIIPGLLMSHRALISACATCFNQVDLLEAEIARIQ